MRMHHNGRFNHGHMKWKSLESTGDKDQEFIFLIQNSFLTQQVLESTIEDNVLYKALSSLDHEVDNVTIY